MDESQVRVSEFYKRNDFRLIQFTFADGQGNAITVQAAKLVSDSVDYDTMEPILDLKFSVKLTQDGKIRKLSPELLAAARDRVVAYLEKASEGYTQEGLDRLDEETKKPGLSYAERDKRDKKYSEYSEKFREVKVVERLIANLKKTGSVSDYVSFAQKRNPKTDAIWQRAVRFWADPKVRANLPDACK